MGDGGALIPSPLARVDGLAQANGDVVAPDEPVQPCIKPWKLKVTVHSQETFWPKERVKVDAIGPNTKSGGVTMKSVDSRERGFIGMGKTDYDVSASVDHWVVVATKKVTMTNGATESVVIDIKCRPWIGFKVINAKTKKAIKDVTLKVEAAGPGKKDVAAEKGTAVVWDIADGTANAKVEAIEHAGAWVYTGSSTSDEPTE
jgi:hypothetical protein